jgi:hypothetical protein
MSPEERKKEREREREKNAIYSGQLRLCQQPRAAHALRSDQFHMIFNKEDKSTTILVPVVTTKMIKR